HGRGAVDLSDRYAAVSPVRQIRPGLPPTWLVPGRQRPVRGAPVRRLRSVLERPGHSDHSVRPRRVPTAPPAGAELDPWPLGGGAPGTGVCGQLTRISRVAPGLREAVKPLPKVPRLVWLHRSRTLAGRVRPSCCQVMLTVRVPLVPRLNSATT